MDDSDDLDGLSWSDPDQPRPRGPELLTLALLEDIAAVLHRHGYPALRGYALTELASSLYRLQGP